MVVAVDDAASAAAGAVVVEKSRKRDQHWAVLFFLSFTRQTCSLMMMGER